MCTIIGLNILFILKIQFHTLLSENKPKSNSLPTSKRKLLENDIA